MLVGTLIYWLFSTVSMSKLWNSVLARMCHRRSSS